MRVYVIQKMVKYNTSISLRIPDSTLFVVDALAKEYKVNRTKVIMFFIDSGLLNPELKNKLSSKMNSDVELYTLRTDRKDSNNKLYIIKNMYQRVMDMAMSYNFTVGNINMKVINSVLDSFQKEYDCFPEKYKKLIGSDFKTGIKQLRDEDYLITNVERLKLLRGK